MIEHMFLLWIFIFFHISVICTAGDTILNDTYSFSTAIDDFYPIEDIPDILGYNKELINSILTEASGFDLNTITMPPTSQSMWRFSRRNGPTQDKELEYIIEHFKVLANQWLTAYNKDDLLWMFNNIDDLSDMNANIDSFIKRTRLVPELFRFTLLPVYIKNAYVLSRYEKDVKMWETTYTTMEKEPKILNEANEQPQDENEQLQDEFKVLSYVRFYLFVSVTLNIFLVVAAVAYAINARKSGKNDDKNLVEEEGPKGATELLEIVSVPGDSMTDFDDEIVNDYEIVDE